MPETALFMRYIISPLIICLCLFSADAISAETGKKVIYPSVPFKPGEKLIYSISWSNIVDAGMSVMEVKEITRPDGKKAYNFISTAWSTGMIGRFYKVSDRVESVIDAEKFSSLSFSLDQTHGKRKKKREMRFDQVHNTVTVITDGKEASYTVPPVVQDSLSSLYYVRTRQDFAVGKPIMIDVHEDGKTWAVEVYTLGREKIKTALGEFDTIKIKTYPKYEGVFRHTGEIYIWLTDDARKLPVFMKSEISIGTIDARLVEIRNGDIKN